ncbi:MAG TPA: hypothetical protein VGW57_13605 [Chthoniobacterales bacterium]|nr:hypothetical protein [Chthoniobacterales bacterium]
MRALLASDIIRMWEASRDRSPLERSLSLLAGAEPETPRDTLAALSIGRRDARLLDLRRRIFGETIQAYAECPECAGQLELDFLAGTIQSVEDSAPEMLELKRDGVTVRFRLPTSADLAEANGATGIAEAKTILLERCVVEARKDEEPLAVADLPAEAIEEMNRSLEAADPGAEVWLNLRCPYCEHSWRAFFDIAAFLWKEISAQARRLLHEVDAIARAYGWREAEILGLSALRRQAYLELIGA